MEDITAEFFRMIHRFHICRPKFRKQGGLADVEFLILMGIAAMLEKKEDGITLGEIIQATGMSMSAASKKITILEKKGLIERRTSEKDRRNVYITLTDKGKKICEKERQEKHDWLVEVIHRMGEENVWQMIHLLNKIFDIMEEMEQEAAGNGQKGEKSV